MMKLTLETRPTSPKIVLVVFDSSHPGEIVRGTGDTIHDAAGWVLYHLQRQLEETAQLFEAMGVGPTPISRLRPEPGRP